MSLSIHNILSYTSLTLLNTDQFCQIQHPASFLKNFIMNSRFDGDPASPRMPPTSLAASLCHVEHLLNHSKNMRSCAEILNHLRCLNENYPMEYLLHCQHARQSSKIRKSSHWSSVILWQNHLLSLHIAQDSLISGKVKTLWYGS